jgi:hypothetical protein
MASIATAIFLYAGATEQSDNIFAGNNNLVLIRYHFDYESAQI